MVHGENNGCCISTAAFNSLICSSLTFFQSRSQHLYRELKQIDDELIFEVRLAFRGLELACGFLLALKFPMSLGYRSMKSTVEGHFFLQRNWYVESREGNCSEVNCGNYAW